MIPANLKPSRSRNGLVDPFLYRRIWREARFQVKKELLRSTGEVDSFIERELQKQAPDQRLDNPDNNPFSADSYMAIQFTSRQLIKYRSPVYDDVKNLKSAIKELDNPTLKKLADRVDIAHLSKEQAFFYPFEVQIMDIRSYEDTQSGLSGHSAYKEKQVQVAAHRVLGALAKHSGLLKTKI